MTHADSAAVREAAGKNPYAVNVALIDSGTDYSANMNIVKRETFVDGYDDSNLQKTMNEKIDGTSPYINVYSAKALDSNNRTTVNRLVKAIDWAVENNVNIINISCGVNSDSAKLHSAVKKAYNKGILLVAAAGNGGNIQYPAKYEEVMAVGVVTCNGTFSKSGSTGEQLEVVAPGQDVTSYGLFGMLTNFSGSSMAAPQVTALAAVLWQQDLSKDSGFIRQLIDVAARSLGKKEKFGYGLIDSNTETLLCLDERTVVGVWQKGQHESMIYGMGKI